MSNEQSITPGCLAPEVIISDMLKTGDYALVERFIAKYGYAEAANKALGGVEDRATVKKIIEDISVLNGMRRIPLDGYEALYAFAANRYRRMTHQGCK